jgi:AraC-like DNA-binding protein
VRTLWFSVHRNEGNLPYRHKRLVFSRSGQRLCALAGGDFVFLPNPPFYTLQSSRDTPIRSIREITSQQEFNNSRLIKFDGQNGPPTTLVAGCFTFDSPESEMLVKHLPSIVHLEASGPHATSWFHSTLQFIATEASHDLPGGTAIVDRLTEVLFVQAMRSRMTSTFATEKPSWLRALADPQMGAALSMMHAEPGRPWTVSDLAKSVSMSRSAFAERFRKLAGDCANDAHFHIAPLQSKTLWDSALIRIHFKAILSEI